VINADNILAHELIGLRAKILESPCRSYKGMQGEIVDETRNLLVISCAGKEIRVPKDLVLIRIFAPSGFVDVPGELLVGRPEDRLKKFWRKKYGKLWRQKLPGSRGT
jgi:ribonuclease P protein subunit POP4